ELSALERVFAADGPLAAQVDGYRPRPQQVEMARAILEAIETGRALAVEAGTGTGQTVADLVPGPMAGGQVIASAGAKTLQAQLHNRDLPAVREALVRVTNAGATTALLKGRANYVCLYRMERALAEGVDSREDAARLRIIERFARRSLTGDKG